MSLTVFVCITVSYVSIFLSCAILIQLLFRQRISVIQHAHLMEHNCFWNLTRNRFREFCNQTDQNGSNFVRLGMSSIQVNRFELRVLTLFKNNAPLYKMCLVRVDYIVTYDVLKINSCGSFSIAINHFPCAQRQKKRRRSRSKKLLHFV